MMTHQNHNNNNVTLTKTHTTLIMKHKLMHAFISRFITTAITTAVTTIFTIALAVLAALTAVTAGAAPNDLNGDLKSDLIFRNDATGQITAWLMNGTTATTQTGLIGSGAWTVTHVADFNGDGRADILYRNDDGSVTLWLMNGTTVIGSVGLLGANADWKVSHVGDFNGDGKADVLWRNTNGAVTIWLMDGINVLSRVGVLGPDANWRVSHVGDFNGDGKADLLWRNTGGNVTMWLMNGGTATSTPGILGADANWRVSHVGDFNGDGRADILWRNNDGSVTLWLMNGGSAITTAGLLGADPNWQVTHVGDLNGDGKADLVWRNTNGAVTAWLMNGITNIGSGGILGADPNWRVSHLADYNGDGRADILWRNNADGQITMWLMNGLAAVSQVGILGASTWRIVPPYVDATITSPPPPPPGSSTQTLTLKWDYNANGHVAALTYPDASKVGYTLNALGEATTLSNTGGAPGAPSYYANVINYHPTGAIAGFTYGNNVVHAQTLNTRNLPSQRSDAGVMNDSYAYDANGNTASITDNQQAISSRSMTYDGLDRLTTANGPNLWGNGTYTYDPLDNLRMSTLGSVTTTRNYDATTTRLNSLQSNTLGTTNISYDLQGNVSQRGSQAFGFDQANRLQSATGKASYRYDGLGRRTVINAADGSTSVQFYSSAGRILYSTIVGGSSGAGSATRYVYLGQRLIAETKTAGSASTTRYIHTDGLGSPVAHTDASGAVVDRSHYEAYGANVNIAGSTNPVGIGFTGHVNDVDTGLVYMQQRYYDPVAGRFLSTDQVLTDTSSGAMFNRYDYGNNNPYKYLDHDGNAPTPADVFFIAMDAGGLIASVGLNGYARVTGDHFLQEVSGAAIGPAAISLGLSVVSLAIPVPGAGQVLKAEIRTEIKAVEIGSKIDKAAILAENKVVGKAGEAATSASLGATKAGEQVTFVTSTGSRTKIDFVTNTQGGKGVVETKTGGATLSSGQKDLKADVAAGRAVTPVGKNADKAGLPAGKPVVIKDFKIDQR
jgi:RHS repeat-associated protein